MCIVVIEHCISVIYEFDLAFKTFGFVLILSFFLSILVSLWFRDSKRYFRDKIIYLPTPLSCISRKLMGICTNSNSGYDLFCLNKSKIAIVGFLKIGPNVCKKLS